MEVTIIGASDAFARGIAEWAVGAGHDVAIVGPSLARAEAFAATVRATRAAGPGDPLRHDLIVVAMPYDCVLDVRDSYGDQLDGRIVVDVTTPVDFNTSEAIRPEAGSAAQEIARTRPRARVVKAYNPAFTGALAGGKRRRSTDEVLIAGDDGEAKRIVARFFEGGGLHAVDVGPLRRADELEALGYRQLLAGQRFSGAP